MRDHADSALGTERAWDFRRVQVLGARSCSTAGRPAVPLAFSTGGRPAWPHGLRAGADSGVHRGDSLAPGATARDAMGRDVLKRVTAESRWHMVWAVARLLTATPRPGLEEWGCAPGSWAPLVSGLVGVAALGLASLLRSSRIAGGGMVCGVRTAVPRPGVNPFTLSSGFLGSAGAAAQ